MPPCRHRHGGLTGIALKCRRLIAAARSGRGQGDAWIRISPRPAPRRCSLRDRAGVARRCHNSSSTTAGQDRDRRGQRAVRRAGQPLPGRAAQVRRRDRGAADHADQQGRVSVAAPAGGPHHAACAGRRQLRDHRRLREGRAGRQPAGPPGHRESRRAGTPSTPSCARSGGCSTSRSGCSPAATCRSRRLRDLKGKRILIGTPDSGARRIAGSC